MSNLKHSEWLQINDLIHSLYSVSDTKKMRRAFLETLRLLVYYDHAMFDFSKSNHMFFDPISVNINDEFLRRYVEHFQNVDYVRWIFYQPDPVIYKDTNLIDNKLRTETEFFRNWLCPLGSYYGGGTAIVHDGTLLGSLTLFRSEEHHDFSERDLFIFDVLNTHLSNRLNQMFPQGVKQSHPSKKSKKYSESQHLTNRESEIVELVIEGYNNQEISDILYISVTTVKKHLNNIFLKLNIKSRTQLIRFFQTTK